MVMRKELTNIIVSVFILLATFVPSLLLLNSIKISYINLLVAFLVAVFVKKNIHFEVN